MAIYTVHGGHAAEGKLFAGAAGFCNESTEDRKIKDAVIKYLKMAGHDAYDCTVDTGNSQSNVISQIKSKINLHNNATANISIHLNAFNKTDADGITKGTECCVSSTNGRQGEIAERICKKIAELGFNNRGVKLRNNLAILKGITNGGDNILVESFFCDDEDDYLLYKKVGPDATGKAIAEGILNMEIHENGLANTHVNGIWYYYQNGKIDKNFNGLAKNKNGWFYIKNGQVDFSFNGFVTNDNGTWYCEKGKITFKKNDVIKDDNGIWWNVVNSKVTPGITVSKNSNGWWYIDKEGKVDFSYNGLAQNQYGVWLIKNGKVNFDFNGEYEGKITCKIQNGKLIIP